MSRSDRAATLARLRNWSALSQAASRAASARLRRAAELRAERLVAALAAADLARAATVGTLDWRACYREPGMPGCVHSADGGCSAAQLRIDGDAVKCLAYSPAHGKAVGA